MEYESGEWRRTAYSGSAMLTLVFMSIGIMLVGLGSLVDGLRGYGLVVMITTFFLGIVNAELIPLLSSL